MRAASGTSSDVNLSEPFELDAASVSTLPRAPRLSVVVSTCNRSNSQFKTLLK